MPEQDPLDTPASQVDLTYPRLPATNYEMVVADAKTVRNKRQDGDNLEVQFKTLKDVQSTKGETVPAGFQLTYRIGLTETEKRKNVNIAKDVVRLIKAAKLGDSMTAKQLIANPSQLNGKVLIVKVGIRQETAEFPESNDVRSIVLEG